MFVVYVFLIALLTERYVTFIYSPRTRTPRSRNVHRATTSQMLILYRTVHVYLTRVLGISSIPFLRELVYCTEHKTQQKQRLHVFFNNT